MHGEVHLNHKPWILVVRSEPGGTDSASDRSIAQLKDAIEAEGYRTEQTTTPADGLAIINTQPSYACVVLDWDLPEGQQFEERAAVKILRAVRARNKNVPIFLIADKTLVSELPLEVVKEVHEYIHLLADTPTFVANRIDFAIKRYLEKLLPPYFRALKQYAEEGSYTWDAPGHMGGVAFLKHPIGNEFHQFYGENIFRTDIGISASQLGSWLDHEGPPGEAERNAARIFGADWTFFVLAGSSTANRIVGQATIGAQEVVVADRNCHKSINHALTLTQARPVYCKATRNGYGLIGLVPARRFEPDALKALIDASPLASKAVSKDPVLAVVTGPTYDGLCYHVNRLVEILAKSVPRVHVDEAWYAYAKFHPMFRERYLMGVPRTMPNRPALFSVHSTHKTLPAFSMGSMVHIQPSPRAPIDHDQFNEAFMMHGTTSPFYPLIASLDVAAAMMEEPAGTTLMDETIDDAIALRKAIDSIARRLRKQEGKGSWFFDAFQPDSVRDPKTGKQHVFCDAPDKLLTTEPSCWTLKPGESWHGFADEDVAGDFYMLDPTKVTLLTPGIRADGHVLDSGIPAPIVTKFLYSHRIDIAKTGDYTLLMLFSVGTTKGKWGTLLEALMRFKRLYDDDVRLSVALPELVDQFRARYGNMTLRQLSQEMHEEMVRLQLPALLCRSCEAEPVPVLTPAEAYQKLVRFGTEMVRISEAAERISAVMVVTYPPGVPTLMPGERTGPAQGPVLRFLSAIEEFDKKFPGFNHELHGIEADEEGNFWMRCVIETPATPPRRTPPLHKPSRSRSRGRTR